MKKIILASATIVFLMMANSSYAISATAAEKNTENQTTAAVFNSSVGNEEQSAVEFKSKKKKKNKSKDENIVPVLELKGGVDVTPASPLMAWLGGEPFQGWVEGEYATGDWGGLRSTLEEHGVTIEAVHLSDVSQKLYGGIQKSRYPHKAFGVIDTAIILDTEKMGLWHGGTAVTRFQHKYGNGLGDRIGAFQDIDAYDVRRFTQLSEYWYEQALFKDRLKLKIGKQDACYDFLALDMAPNFINNSHAYFMPNIPLPAYPDQALGVVLKIEPTEWLSFKSGWYDGKAKGGTSGFDTAFSGGSVAFLIEELGIRHNMKNMPGTFLTGYWLHTGHVDELKEYAPGEDPTIIAQTMGWYMEAEQMIWKEKKDDAEDTQGLSVLGQFSWAPSDRSEISRYYGSALMYKGLFPKRDDDIFGLGAAVAQLSGRLKHISDDGRKGAETILEMFYKAQITKWFSVQPFTQVVFNPDGKNPNAFALGLRTMISF